MLCRQAERQMLYRALARQQADYAKLQKQCERSDKMCWDIEDTSRATIEGLDRVSDTALGPYYCLWFSSCAVLVQHLTWSCPVA